MESHLVTMSSNEQQELDRVMASATEGELFNDGKCLSLLT